MENKALSTKLKKIIATFSCVLCVIAISACGAVEDKGSGDFGSTELDTAKSPFYVTVTSNFERSTAKTLVGTCFFDTTTTPGPAATKTCTIRLPELDLYYSDLNFTVGTSSALNCGLLSFYPYYYIRTDSGNYGSGGKDCSAAAPADIECYGGAAPALMTTDFPTNSGRYFLPANSLTTEYTIPASNTTRQAQAAGTSQPSLYTNAQAASNLATGPRGTTLVYNGTTVKLDYLQNTFHDYKAYCQDSWGNNLYTLKIIIADEDTTTGTQDDGIDSFWDWFD